MIDGALPRLSPPFSLLAFDIIGSTNDEAKARAEQGAAHGTIVWALEQSAGRGRMDRQWSSPRGNLFMSVVLRPANPAAEVALAGFVAALAVADMVAHFLPAEVRIGLKWPNDVLVEGGKIAGLLLEASAARHDGVDWLVLGIGVNLAAAPQAALYPTAALARYVEPPQPIHALEVLTTALGARLATWQAQGFAPLRRDWLALAHQPGTRLTVRRHDGATEGEFVDLDADGTLLLWTHDGLKRITAGDVHLPALEGSV